MGVYYFFYNVRLQTDNVQKLDGFCAHVAKLDFEDCEYYFKKTLEFNPDWLSTDKIIAHADYSGYPSYTYENGELQYNEYEETEEKQYCDYDCIADQMIQ
jgi:hypothetical protein